MSPAPPARARAHTGIDPEIADRARHLLGPSSERSNTKSNIATALYSFLKFCARLDTDKQAMIAALGTWQAWSPKTRAVKFTVVVTWVSSVSLNHSKVKSSHDYLHRAASWLSNHNVAVIWDEEISKILVKCHFWRSLDDNLLPPTRPPRLGYTPKMIAYLNYHTFLLGRREVPINTQSTFHKVLCQHLNSLRSSMFTSLVRPHEASMEKNRYSPVEDWTRGDVSVYGDPKMPFVNVRPPRRNRIKNGFGNQWADLPIEMGQSEGDTSPYATNAADAILNMLRVDPVSDEDTPLFRDTRINRIVDGPIPIPFLVWVDRLIIQECTSGLFSYNSIYSYTAYSYRIGATNTLVRKKCPKHMLHGMGRWIKDGWKTYVNMNPERRAKWAAALAYKSAHRRKSNRPRHRHPGVRTSKSKRTS